MRKSILIINLFILVQIVVGQEEQSKFYTNSFNTMNEWFAYDSTNYTQKELIQQNLQELNFSEVFSYDLGDYFCENHIGIEDFDNDGKTDLVIFATRGNPPPNWDCKIILLHNEGNWQFSDSIIVEYNNGYGYWVSTGDLNNDNWADFVIKTAGSTRVFLNDQSGGFLESWGGGPGFRCIDLADVNDDNSLDILSGDAQTQNGGLAEVFLNDGTGNNFQLTWQSGLYGQSNGGIHDIIAANLNDNSEKDIVATEFYDGLLITFSGDGTGNSFNEEMIKELGDRAFSLSIGNINGDVFSDIGVYVGWGEVRTFTTNDIDSLTEFWVSPNFGEAGFNIALEDFNQDGFSDLFVGTFSTGQLFIYENQSGTDFSLVWSDTLLGFGYTGTATDLNNDSYPDLIVGEKNNIHLLINTGTSSIDEESKPPQAPNTFFLSQNYPNPFNQLTTINYQLYAPALVEISVYDVFGEKIQTLVNCKQQSGQHSIVFDGSDMASGIYYCRLSANSVSQVKKMILLPL